MHGPRARAGRGGDWAAGRRGARRPTRAAARRGARGRTEARGGHRVRRRAPPAPQGPVHPCRAQTGAVEVVVGRGASSTKVLKQYRVLDIHDKYYNKWFMSKEPRKVFGKDTKYKLKVRMQEVSPVQEYKDVDLNGGSYEKAAISRLLTDGEVKHVVGKLKRV